MKICPTCQRVFDNDAGFCPQDGTHLTTASAAPAVPRVEDRHIGARLCGRYEIRRVIADGGMGRVYEGIDKQTDSRIAVKVLHEDVARDEVSLERFKREYEISALLPHEHIVRVLDFQHDSASSTWLLVMEYLDGEELRCVLKRDRVLGAARLVRMLSQVAVGLDGAHARNFIHRDIKPDNLFLCGTREGDVVKLLDFGSVKDQSGQRKKLTMLGTTIGSPYYMSPEQAQGLESIDARADVFALGAVTYECITGEVPFGGVNGPSILLAILTQEPVWPSRRIHDAAHPIPPDLDCAIAKALAKVPAMRFPSVGALADAVGHAYGLSGHHREWATTPQHVLGSQIDAAMSALVAPRVEALDVVADPFAASPGSAQGLGGAERALDAALSSARPAEVEAYGVPTRAPWVLPLVVGLVALLVGGVATFAVLMAR
jgi:serine/threonine-protein kinase